MRPRHLALLVPLVPFVAAMPAAAQTHAGSLNHTVGAPIIGFGAAAAVSGDEIFVSRPGEFAAFPMPGSEAGSVHVFRRGEDGWREVVAIQAPSGVYGDGFGTALDVVGDVLVVGAPKENESRGAAYVFVREGSMWNFWQRLEAPDAMPGDAFGSSVAIGTASSRPSITNPAATPTGTGSTPIADSTIRSARSSASAGPPVAAHSASPSGWPAAAAALRNMARRSATDARRKRSGRFTACRSGGAR